jgi:hypothetical protein
MFTVGQTRNILLLVSYEANPSPRYVPVESDASILRYGHLHPVTHSGPQSSYFNRVHPRRRSCETSFLRSPQPTTAVDQADTALMDVQNFNKRESNKEAGLNMEQFRSPVQGYS